MNDDTTTCCIIGGGPAGAVLGLLLARAGIDVIVLEKHGDFLRDFRGDTIHPSTMDVLDEIGLGAEFERLEHRKITQLMIVTDEGENGLTDLGLLRGRHPYIAMVPQWDFLTMITNAASRLPNFRLRMRAEATGLVRAGGRVTGVRYRDEHGTEREIRALLTVAADGRHSVLRRAAGLRLREYGAPMDAVWFRLPRARTDREDTFFRIGPGRMMVAINRTSYWQLAYVIPKGGFEALRGEGIEALRRRVAELVPFTADRVAELDFDRVGVLSVQVDRLRRWYRPGFLCIGDAAHAMSPVGGVGINLAIQDAVATANRLAGPLRAGLVEVADLAAVQRRRQVPTALVQAFQLAVQTVVIRAALRGDALPVAKVLRTTAHIRPLGRVLARFIGYGPLPEHVRVPATPWTAPRAPTPAGPDARPGPAPAQGSAPGDGRSRARTGL